MYTEAGLKAEKVGVYLVKHACLMPEVTAVEMEGREKRFEYFISDARCKAINDGD